MVTINILPQQVDNLAATTAYHRDQADDVDGEQLHSGVPSAHAGCVKPTNAIPAQLASHCLLIFVISTSSDVTSRRCLHSKWPHQAKCD